MTIFGIIFFVIGIILILLGVGLIIYSACRKKPAVATNTDTGLLSTILDFVFKVLDLIFKNMPKDQMSTAGLVLVVVGIGLALLPFVVPGL